MYGYDKQDWLTRAADFCEQHMRWALIVLPCVAAIAALNAVAAEWSWTALGCFTLFVVGAGLRILILISDVRRWWRDLGREYVAGLSPVGTADHNYAFFMPPDDGPFAHIASAARRVL